MRKHINTNIWIILLYMFFLFPLTACSDIKVNSISVSQLKKKINVSAIYLIIDVRTKEEFHGNLGHVKDSKLIPLDLLEQKIKSQNKYKNLDIYVICRSGNRSYTASKILMKAGFKKIFNVKGGMIAWNDAGYPVER